MNKYTELVPYPGDDAINTNVSPLHQSTVLGIFGEPALKTAKVLAGGESEVTNPRLARMIVTESVGPFRVTGHKQAVASLREVLRDVHDSLPDLYAVLGTEGMICCRLVRGSKVNWSNHAFGFSVDVTVGGVLDKRGDGMVQKGLLLLYGVFKLHGWYWGAEYNIEDAMHFEPGDALVRKWQKAGLL